jgi:hypothetical protein
MHYQIIFSAEDGQWYLIGELDKGKMPVVNVSYYIDRYHVQRRFSSSQMHILSGEKPNFAGFVVKEIIQGPWNEKKCTDLLYDLQSNVCVIEEGQRYNNNPNPNNQIVLLKRSAGVKLKVQTPMPNTINNTLERLCNVI